jgi:hypothetical protein
MAGQTSRIDVATDEIALDGTGRIAIANAALAERAAVAAARKSRRRKPKPNVNCGTFCNTTKDCAGDPNITCSPNTKANCCCKLA